MKNERNWRGLSDQFVDLDLGFGAHQNIVPVDPVVDGINKVFFVADVFQFDLQRFTVLFHKIKDLVSELYDHDLRGKHFFEAILNDQQVIGVNVHETKRIAVF